MGHAVEQWTNSIMSQMPRGILWQRETSLDLYKYAQGYAPRLEQAEVSAESLLYECALKPRLRSCLNGKNI